jgi:hypothetical protein
MKIYIASSEKNAGKIQEDIYLRDTYRSMGFFSEIGALKDIVKNSQPLDVVLLKSIWGYHIDHQEFLEKISILKTKNIKLINDYDFILWNIHKYEYLNKIKHMGIVPMVPLQFGSAGTISEICSEISKAGEMLDTVTLVIKPCISESGYLTFKYETNGDNKMTLALLKKNKHLDFIAQPYRSTLSQGEVSAVIINGVPLYGIKRFPGTFYDKLDSVYIKLNDVPGAILKKVALLRKYFLKRFGLVPNICRVDFLKANVGYEILEVELIDPDLYFRYIPESVKKRAVSLLCKAFHK